MYRTIIALSAVSACACTAGPNRAVFDDYRPPAVSIHATFVDLPATGAESVGLNAYWIYAEGGKPTTQRNAASAYAQLHSDAVEFQLQGNYSYPRMTSFPELRFFTLYASVWTSRTPPNTKVGYWGHPGLNLVYALRARSWSPFGPGGQTVDLPQGYSWLLRTCGPLPGQIQMETRPIEEAIELRAINNDTDNDPGAGLEQSEEAFVQSCGMQLGVADLGTRISFDRAQSLVWSPDATSIYYLAEPAAQDPHQSAGLRQIRTADSVSSELTTIPHGSGLQIGKTGMLFVSTTSQLLLISPAAPTTSTALSFPFDPFMTIVSPDGRWVTHDIHDPQSGVRAAIWDVQANADIVVFDGYVVGWSPDSRLDYWSNGNALGVLSPSDSGSTPTTYPLTAFKLPWKRQVVWTDAGPLIASSPVDSPQGEASCGGCFGFSLLDPVTGIERPVLDATAGRISMASATPVLGSTFLWAKSCLGLLDTACSYSLIRVDLATATAQVVATSTESIPVAVSSDGRRVAFGASTGIYVKDLSQ